MRYFLLLFVLAGVMVVGVAGFRGSTSRKPPIEVFPDMDRQPKLRPQDRNSFFPDGRSSQAPPEYTVARTKAYEGLLGVDPIFPYQESPVNSGLITGTTNFVESIPFQITERFLDRGRDRYQIYCLPCHGAIGDANGVIKKVAMPTVANLHEARIIQMTDGQIYYAIKNGSPSQLMGSYAAQVTVEERWAIVAYVRALQRSRLGSLDDVPESLRSTLSK